MTLVKISAIAFAAAMTTAALSPAALAMEETLIEGNVVRPVAYVTYSDLDLGTDAGVQALNDRVRRAANAMCMERGVRNIRLEMAGIACRKAAVSSAAPQITAAINNAGTQVASNATATAITVAMP